MNYSSRVINRFIVTSSFVVLLAACQVGTVTPPPVNSLPPVQQAVQHSAPVKDRYSPEPAAIPAVTEESEIVQQDNLWQLISDNLTVQQQFEHASIDEELAWYLDNPDYLDRITTRAAPFLFSIVQEIQERELPLELALLPVVESAYDPTAYSPEQAAGLWQFIPSTARSFGLSTDWWYDGRRDPLASTRAALDYLKFLHEKFEGNWLLAIAAYNAGEGSVRRALRRGGQAAESADFWSLRLPAETRGHVPKLLAIARLIANAEEFGIQLPVLPSKPYLETIDMDFQLDLATAAQIAGVDEKLLRTLNAGYLQWATHPDYPQSLVIPRNQAQQFKNAIANLPEEQRVAWDHYQIRRGDTLGAIARRYHTRVEILQSVNDLRGTRIVAGNSLLIPRAGSLASSTGIAPAVNRRDMKPSPTSYRVRRGDSLWGIARRFNLRSKDIAAWNGIALDSVLHPGQQLTLHPTGYLAAADVNGSEEVRTVKYSIISGDSLDRIARLFNVTVSDLASWNNLDPTVPIFPEQEIVVRIPTTKYN